MPLLPWATIALTSILPALPVSTVVDSCASERIETLAQVEGRNAWAVRCLPHVPAPETYPQGDFVSVVGFAVPRTADAPCVSINEPVVVCTAEGLLQNQRLRTEQGLVAVADLVERGVTHVGTWDSFSPVGSSPVMTKLVRVVRRPYKGAIISLQSEEGGLLDVTAGQPLLLANGTLMRADLLMVGDALLGQNRKHYVARVAQGHRTVWSYQPVVARFDFDHNILAVDDLYVGSSRLVQDGLAPKYR